MPYARIWYELTGVKITYFVDGSDPGQAIGVLKADGHVERNATFDDFDTESELRAVLPPDRTERAKWRKALVGRGVRVDRSLP